MIRPNDLEYKFLITLAVATRGTCDRLRAAATIWAGNRLIATGYNGSAKGQPHCDEVGHYIVGGHCIRTIHAEENALLQAAQFGISVQGCELVVNAPPCIRCLMRAKNAGISKVYYTGEYYNSGSQSEINELVGAGMEIIKVDIDFDTLIKKHLLRVLSENYAIFSKSRSSES
jgi:dCMP deaminase